jgi:glucose-6-phosphate isomerase
MLNKSNKRQKLIDLKLHDSGIRAQFEVGDTRVEDFSFNLNGINFDFSKTHMSNDLIDEYATFAEERNLTGFRTKLFSGEKINITEQRSVLHPLLRDLGNHGIEVDDCEFISQAQISQERLYQHLAGIQELIKQRTVPIKNIIHVGIGGSSLGTQLLFEALKKHDESVAIHFLGNIDAHQLTSILAQCDVTDTIVIGVSKTFSTAETLQNIRSIKAWYEESGGEVFYENLYAVTANEVNATKFGVASPNIITFPNWVGGRYSVWSAVSLSAMILLGASKFKEFLLGAAEADKHFVSTPLEQNISFIAAALDHYYTNDFEAQSRAIFAYDHRLRSLVGYLQQLETESNGKDRQRNGDKVDQKTSPVLWGGVGTDAQHSVFQMLHQGTNLIPTEFILVVNPEHNHVDHHRELLANGIAQAAALLAGQDEATVRSIHADDDLSELAIAAKIFSGDRPSTTILLDELTPSNLGSLLAFYEHRTFCFGVLANINSFDQMGVELGKRLAVEILPLLAEDSPLPTETTIDQSTLETIKKITELSRQ